MFHLKKKVTPGLKTIFRVEGMHCPSCALGVDNELETVEGVFSSKTSYARAITTVFFDPARTKEEEIMSAIRRIGYVPKQEKRSS